MFKSFIYITFKVKFSSILTQKTSQSLHELNKCFSVFTQNSEYFQRIQNRDFVELNVNNFEELIENNKEIKEKISKILNEYEFEKNTTFRVPKSLSIEYMKDLLITKCLTERRLLFNYWFKIEMKKTNQIKNKNLLKHKKLIELSDKPVLEKKRIGIFDENSGEPLYGLWRNSLFQRITEKSLKNYAKHRLRNASLFGQKLVIDLGFDSYLRLNECRLLARQLVYTYCYNRYECEEPFDLYFANCDSSRPTMQSLYKYFGSRLYSKDSMLSFNSVSYLDLFPYNRQELVYLSPHASQPLLDYNHNHIYIIGGIVDKSCHDPFTLIKAEREGIQSFRLPLSESIEWNKGSKSLCLNQMIAILNHMKTHMNWKIALETNIPKRKLKSWQQINKDSVSKYI